LYVKVEAADCEVIQFFWICCSTKVLEQLDILLTDTTLKWSLV